MPEPELSARTLLEIEEGKKALAKVAREQPGFKDPNELPTELPTQVHELPPFTPDGEEVITANVPNPKPSDQAPIPLPAFGKPKK